MTSDEMQSFDYESAITSMISTGDWVKLLFFKLSYLHRIPVVTWLILGLGGNSLGDEELESLLTELSSTLTEDDHDDHDDDEDHDDEDHEDEDHEDEDHDDHDHDDHGHESATHNVIFFLLPISLS